ncbi:MAG TPA: glycosyltransferase [Gemmatimonadales bacterium]|nr:glycosyltransferase [Gemmatimonadales bacterium]
MTPGVSVVICTYNRVDRLGETLRTLAAADPPARTEWELIVVDNNSTDSTGALVEIVARRFPCPLRYVFEPQQGKSFALNSGIAHARGDILAFTDDDVLIGKNWLSALWRAFHETECAGVGGRIQAEWTVPRPSWYTASGPFRLMNIVSGEYDYGPTRSVVGPDRPPFGANMAWRRSVFQTYGVFRTDLGYAGRARLGGEDTEYSRRVLVAGELVVYEPEALVRHVVEPEKLTKAFFRHRYYNYGRVLARVDQGPSLLRRYFGIPRYLFRDLATHATRWALASSGQARFYHDLQCWQLFGAAVESVRLHRAQGGGRRGARA